jgi:iron uptake system component EfeO
VRHPTRVILLPLAAAGMIAAVAGCGSSSNPPAGAKTLSFTLTDAGCEPAEAKAPAEPVNFEVTNDGSTNVTDLEVLDGDKVLGERENITEGLSGSFALTLEKGQFTLYCPNGTESERGTLTVTGGSGSGARPGGFVGEGLFASERP